MNSALIPLGMKKTHMAVDYRSKCHNVKGKNKLPPYSTAKLAAMESWNKNSSATSSPRTPRARSRSASYGNIGNRGTVTEAAYQNGGCSTPDLKDVAQELQAKALIPLKEDLAQWLNKLLGIDIDAGNFMDVLDNGVFVCHLAQHIHTKAEANRQNLKTTQHIPENKVRFRPNAKRGSWFARDNTANFLSWCREWGVKQECLFESEDLVFHKHERSVILCLLELARIASTYGVEPPNLVKFEKEIEKEELGSTESLTGGVKSMVFDSPSSSRSSSPCTPRRRLGSGRIASKLHQEVTKLTSQCTCSNCGFQINRISEGKYKIGRKIVFIRLLHGKHLMVRVGGGWDTFEHFLAKHDPCKVIEFERETIDDKYLVIQSKYKSGT
ncbi:growth arrest-specific protein 2 isoform X1 [Lingula anatina]|uniref:Growth arrest-specific protein 2 isoform X1 n=2 Tax=Lingula anatina TaxID=7574 RepID=A0A1S3HPW8_LINAN|nr:growth arrest-specific protein 2 isoform X1 [Lingula anatina]|eukprot:XP_013388082.1 growth arrest-specific protein 2 isoform X1 [Lingula anatina]